LFFHLLKNIRPDEIFLYLGSIIDKKFILSEDEVFENGEGEENDIDVDVESKSNLKKNFIQEILSLKKNEINSNIDKNIERKLYFIEQMLQVRKIIYEIFLGMSIFN
jgi:hypothetical protein